MDAIPSVEAILTDIMPEAARQAISEWLHGGSSAPITVLRLLMIWPEPVRVVTLLERVVEHLVTACAVTSALYRRAAAMQTLLQEYRAGLNQVSAMLCLEQQHQGSGQADPVASAAALFDAWVQASEEASVALYSFGDPTLLAVATAEVVQLFEAWELLGDDRVILQIGCGIGRFEAALAGRVQAAYGIDISAEMIAAARRRCAALPTAYLQTCSGHDLGLFRSEKFDLVYAVDTFPYLHTAGADLVARHFQEVYRVLKPRGSFVILNFSYRGAPDLDRLEVEQLARQHHFEVLENGARPFHVWDGLAWWLRRP
jgi:cyclopropane fatty-acyl-phospholipid synthase-like methyltransferase